MMTLPRTTNTSLPKGRMLRGLTLQGPVRRNPTEGLNHCAPNATITTKVHLLLNATSVTELAIWLVTVRVMQTLTLLTTRRTLVLVRNLPAMSVERQGHFKRECPKLKNRNRDNQGGNDKALAMVFCDGSFVSSTFSSLIKTVPTAFDHGIDVELADGLKGGRLQCRYGSLLNTIPTALDHGIDVELANGRVIRVNTLTRGCTLNFLNHPFNINLIPIEMGSFDVIIGMD
ncbi:hypothetical protein Tco_1364553 [Tanacetum coccineum]